MVNGISNRNLPMESSNNLFLLLANNPSKLKRLLEGSIIKFPLSAPFYKKMLSMHPMQTIYNIIFKLTERVIEYKEPQKSKYNIEI